MGLVVLKFHFLGFQCIISGLGFGLFMKATKALEPLQFMPSLFKDFNRIIVGINTFATYKVIIKKKITVFLHSSNKERNEKFTKYFQCNIQIVHQRIKYQKIDHNFTRRKLTFLTKIKEHKKTVTYIIFMDWKSRCYIKM